MSLKAQWEAEKSVVTEIRDLKEKLENLKTEQAQAQGEGKFFVVISTIFSFYYLRPLSYI